MSSQTFKNNAMDEKKRIQLGGGSQMINDASFIMSISRSKTMENPRIKIIRAKFTPASDNEK